MVYGEYVVSVCFFSLSPHLSDENPDESGGQLRPGGTRGHEGGAGHVGVQVQHWQREVVEGETLPRSSHFSPLLMTLLPFV